MASAASVSSQKRELFPIDVYIDCLSGGGDDRDRDSHGGGGGGGGVPIAAVVVGLVVLIAGGVWFVAAHPDRTKQVGDRANEFGGNVQTRARELRDRIPGTRRAAAATVQPRVPAANALGAAAAAAAL